MKNSKNHLSIVVLLLMAFSACGPKISSEQQSQLKQLEDSVKLLVLNFESIDSNEVKNMADIYYTKREFFLKEMRDTLPPQLAFTISHYMMIKKAIAYMKDSYTPLKHETKVMVEQLDNLKHDVEERLIDAEHFENYYQLESDNYSKMKSAIKDLNIAYSACRQRIDSLDAKLDSVMMAYKEKHNEDPS